MTERNDEYLHPWSWTTWPSGRASCFDDAICINAFIQVNGKLFPLLHILKLRISLLWGILLAFKELIITGLTSKKQTHTHCVVRIQISKFTIPDIQITLDIHLHSAEYQNVTFHILFVWGLIESKRIVGVGNAGNPCVKFISHKGPKIILYGRNKSVEYIFILTKQVRWHARKDCLQK